MGKKKKAKSKPKTTRTAPIQFRTDDEFSKLLEQIASKHDLSLNGAAKYLAALAAHGLDMRHLKPIHQLVEVMGASVERVCSYVARAVQTEEKTRKKQKEPKLDENQRQKLIDASLTQMTQQLRDGYLPTYVRDQLVEPSVVDDQQTEVEVHVRNQE